MALKNLAWVGSSFADFRALPGEVQQTAGFALDRVQRGFPHPAIKPLKGLPGVQEIRVDFDSNTFRVVYVVNLGDKIYVLHAFNKKSKSGIATPKPDMEKIKARLKLAQENAR